MLLSRFHRRRFLTLTIIFVAAGSLILGSFVPLSVTATAQSEARVRRGHPGRGKPVGVFEDIEVLKHRPNLPVRAIDAEPSTIRSPKNPLEPRNGRKVGDPWPTQQIGSFGRNSEKNSVINAQRVDWTSNDLTK